MVPAPQNKHLPLWVLRLHKPCDKEIMLFFASLSNLASWLILKPQLYSPFCNLSLKLLKSPFFSFLTEKKMHMHKLYISIWHLIRTKQKMSNSDRF